MTDVQDRADSLVRVVADGMPQSSIVEQMRRAGEIAAENASLYETAYWQAVWQAVADELAARQAAHETVVAR